MRQTKCAAAVFGIALAAGASLGAVAAFVSVLIGFRTTPAALPTIESWVGSAAVAAVAALVGAIAGAIVAAAAWSLAALVLVLVNLRWPSLAVRASAVALGSAAGAGLALWFFSAQPGVMADATGLFVLSLLAAGLAVVAFLVSERIGSSRAL